MRTLGVDLGTKRVGLALSDEGGSLATPYEVLTVSSPEDALEQVAAVVRVEQARRIIVGLPLNMDDTLGPAARQAIDFGRLLAVRSGTEVLFVDERLSSFDAEQKLVGIKRTGQKMTRGQKKQRLDALAAAAFLQEFLDGRLTPFDPNSADTDED